MRFMFVLAAFIAVIATCASCKKSITASPISSISGNWQLIKDSTSKGVGVSNHVVTYQGSTGDSYDFASDSILTINEHDSVCMYAYTITAASTLTLYWPAQPPYTTQVSYSIDKMNGHELVLTREWLLTPGGIIGQTVYLKR